MPQTQSKKRIKSLYAKQYNYNNETLKGANILATVEVDGAEIFIVLTPKELARFIYNKVDYLISKSV